MEEMKSLGFVQLYYRDYRYSKSYIRSNETGELFIDNVWGKIIFKIKISNNYYALPLLIEDDGWVKFNNENGARYFSSEVVKYYINLYGNNDELGQNSKTSFSLKNLLGIMSSKHKIVK